MVSGEGIDMVFSKRGRRPRVPQIRMHQFIFHPTLYRFIGEIDRQPHIDMFD